MRLRAFVVLVAALLVLASGGAAWSQTVQGVITGTITDPTGAVVPNATVTITNVGTNISQSTTTGGDGSYRFPLVPPGTYTIEIKAGSFATIRVSGIVVEASQTVPFNRQLELAKAQQVIEVTEQAPLVQTASSDLSTQVNRATIENTALVDRDVFAALPFMASGVSPGLDLMPTSGGARESGTTYMLNGGENNDNFCEACGGNVHPPLESVEDFSILTNNMSAEYGRFGAVVSADQKSGGNRFHGIVYEYNRNASLNSADFFFNKNKATPNEKKPQYIRNQFGGEVDGPIFKDKTFFSFAYDRYKILASTSAANNYVPTTAALNYLQMHGGPIAQVVLQAFPPRTSDLACATSPGNTGSGGTNPQGNGLPNAVGCLPDFTDPTTDTNNVYYGRVDHNFSAKDRLSFSANIFRESFVDKFGGGGLTTKGPINATTNNHFHQMGLSETHTFGPRLFNEVTISHNRHFNVGLDGNANNKVPEIIIDNQAAGCLGFVFGQFEGNQVVGFVQDRWGTTDNLTWTVGKHSVKFGGGQQYGILYRNWDLGLPSYYDFAELSNINEGPGSPYPVGNPLCPIGAALTPSCDATLQTNGTIAGIANLDNSNFTYEYPYFQEISINPQTGAKADAYRHYTNHDYYAFVQDDWKVTPRLTLNVGLRWDRFGAPSEDHGILAQFTNISGCDVARNTACIAAARTGPVSRMWQTQNGDIGPRFGFAWDPFGKGKMAVRGGYGIAYDRIFDNIWSNGAWNPPFYALVDSNANSGDAIFYSNPPSTGASYDPANPIPRPGKRVSIRTMDVNMHDSSGQNYFLGVERQLFGGLLVRANYQGSFGRHLPMLENYNRVDGIGYNATLRPVRPNPLYSGFNYRSNSVSSRYNSGVVEVQKSMGHGLQFFSSYVFSKLLDVNSDLFAGCSTIGGSTAPYYYISNAQQHRNFGPAADDHRHAYKFNVIYEIPFMKSQHGFAGHALGGWVISSFYQLYAGHPIDLFTGQTRIRARDAAGNLLLDQNGIPFNIGGDYNLDGVLNDHPNFIGSSVGSVYSGGSPADGIFTDNNRIGCGEAGVPATVNYSKSSAACPAVASTLFGNPAYPSGATPYLRFGTFGRDVFHGPRFQELDMSLGKGFKLTESLKMDFRVQAQNLLNHPSFDCVQSNLNSSQLGKATCLAQSISQGAAGPTRRVMSIGADFKF